MRLVMLPLTLEPCDSTLLAWFGEATIALLESLIVVSMVYVSIKHSFFANPMLLPLVELTLVVDAIDLCQSSNSMKDIVPEVAQVE
jgi:hypothetical protein